MIAPEGLEIRITNIALGASLVDEKGRTTVQLTYDPAPQPQDMDSDAGSDVGAQTTTVLCSLTAGKVRTRFLWLSQEADARLDRASDC